MAIRRFLWRKSRLQIKHFLIQSLVMKFIYMYFKLYYSVQTELIMKNFSISEISYGLCRS